MLRYELKIHLTVFSFRCCCELFFFVWQFQMTPKIQNKTDFCCKCVAVQLAKTDFRFSRHIRTFMFVLSSTERPVVHHL